MNIALIVAGGIGKRMGLDIPKQFVVTNNKPVIFYSLKVFEQCNEIDSIFIVCHKDYIEYLNDIVQNNSLNKVKGIVEGGDTRQQSVFNGLKAIREAKYALEDIVLIHDAARPLITSNIIKDNIETCLKYDACETAIKACDTMIKSKQGEYMDDVVNRDEIYQVQTPQTFKLGLILDSHEKASKLNATDDAQIVKQLGHKVAIVNGSKLNFKITTPEDLELFKSIVK